MLEVVFELTNTIALHISVSVVKNLTSKGPQHISAKIIKIATF